MSKLHFRSDGQFTIVQFTDLHWRNGDDTDRRTRALIERVLETERPDMVVLTGDVIDGANCWDPARSWCEAVAPVAERGIPWAAVFGNHDDEGALSREQLMAVQQKCPNCLSRPGPADLPGVGNYILSVSGSSGDSPAATLYFLDSGGPSPDCDGEYGWITPKQIAWYLEFAGRVPGSDTPVHSAIGASANRLPALVFFHIPIPEFDEVCRLCGWRGFKLEEVCCPQFNSGLFSALRRGGDVLGVFVGHDHLNDFEATLDGIRLCYGRASGYGGYGRDDFPRGARVIRLIEGQQSFQTWIRLEDGHVIIDPPVHPPTF